MLSKLFKNIGPGALIAAAFIGPGTVTICTVSGVHFDYSLLWVLGVAIVATIFLQEMAARIGIITQKGIAEQVQAVIENPILKKVAAFSILVTILIGNTAYEGGNLGGACLGLEVFLGSEYVGYFPFVVGGLAFLLLIIGNYKIVERILVALVILMSISFLITAIYTRPDILEVLKGIFVPSIPQGSILAIAGLIGTTVVPYNIFLHSNLVKQKWTKPSDLKYARMDAVVAIALGGIVSMCIVITATNITTGGVGGVNDLALALEPLMGVYSKYFIGVGLLAAGLTSSITAPLAASYVASGVFGWNAGLKDPRFRFIWIFVLLAGVASLKLNIKPILIIQFAQITNGILLPIIVVFVVWMVNEKSLLGDKINSKWQNIASILIIFFSVVLCLKSLMSVFNLL